MHQQIEEWFYTIQNRKLDNKQEYFISKRNNGNNRRRNQNRK